MMSFPASTRTPLLFTVCVYACACVSMSIILPEGEGEGDRNGHGHGNGHGKHVVTLSNVRLPVDQFGVPLITGEASVLVHHTDLYADADWHQSDDDDGTRTSTGTGTGNVTDAHTKNTTEDHSHATVNMDMDGGATTTSAYYFYFNNWGDCPGVNCCDSADGCASCCFDAPPHPMKACSNPYLTGHTVQDFTTWTNLGVALPLQNRKPGIEFRPCVIYNPKTALFVMWYEDRGADETGYAVATSATPGGPFVTQHINVTMPGAGRIGDFNVFVDEDGQAYHVRTGFDIVLLNENFTGPARHVASFTTPKPSEGPTMFKVNGTYYVTAGTGCCACIGGATIYVYSADLLTGPWKFRGDVGSNPTPFDPHSPNNYVTKAQGSSVFKVGSQVIWLGNQWNSGLQQTPPGPRNHDLLYFAQFAFQKDGSIAQLEYQENITIQL